MRKLILAGTLALAAPAAPAMAFTAPAPADSDSASSWDSSQNYRERRHDRRYERHGRSDRYDRYGRYREPRPLYRNDRVWRGRDGRYYCRRDNGTTGLVIGAALGGLAGHEIAGYGDKTLGTIIGAVGGGLLGRSVDRGDLKCR
jgi:hypothetical protein